MLNLLSKRTRIAVSNFSDDTFGGITALTIVTFLTMFVSVGMAVDFMRHEISRAELQDALDRGVLAATGFSQTVDQKVTVETYMQSTNFLPEDYDLDVKTTFVDGIRTLRAAASYDMRTYFLKLVGINELPIQSAAAARIAVDNIEISLVLDISKSMSNSRTGGTQQTRLEVLKTSAKKFIDKVFDEDSPAQITVSLIPYGGSVSLAGTLYDTFNDNSVHEHSHCLKLNSSDFDDMELPILNSLDQVEQFYHYKATRWASDHENAWCPNDENRAIFHSTDAEALKDAIEDFRGYDGTGTDHGMKWGLAMLNPNSNWLVQDLIENEEMAEGLEDLPAPFGHEKTMKVIVLMTDGGVTAQEYPKPGKYDTEEERLKWLRTRTSNRDLRTHTNQSTTRQHVKDQCKLATDNDVIVYTVAFDIADDTWMDKDMTACATSEGFKYNVKGLDLEEAFEAIAVSIGKLRLVF